RCGAPVPCGAGAAWARAGACTGRLPRLRRLRQELGRSRERDGARAGQIACRIDRRVEGRLDAEDAHHRRSVARPVAEGAGWRAGLGDRAGPTARGTEGPGVALLAVGPRAVAVGARGGQAAADEARLGCRLVAAAGTDARAAVERIAGADAPTVGRAPRCRVALEAAGAGRVDVTAEAAEYVQLTADGLSRLGRRPARQGEGDREAADVVDRRRRAVMGGREALAQRRVG